MLLFNKFSIFLNFGAKMKYMALSQNPVARNPFYSKSSRSKSILSQNPVAKNPVGIKIPSNKIPSFSKSRRSKSLRSQNPVAKNPFDLKIPSLKIQSISKSRRSKSIHSQNPVAQIENSLDRKPQYLIKLSNIGHTFLSILVYYT